MMRWLPTVMASRLFSLRGVIGVLLVAGLFIGVPAVKAAFVQLRGTQTGAPPSQAYWEGATFGSTDMNAESTEKFIGDATMSNWIYRIAGCFTQQCAQAVGVAEAGGAIGGTTKLIATLYENKPASGIQYVASVGQRLRLVQPAYAQALGGTGFQGLLPIQGIWQTFRNVAYFFFVVVFVGVGLAIMFRLKISPQAVVTIQSAIPKLVVALLLVTFSYAIAGFMVDLMYIFIVLVGIMIEPGGWIHDLTVLVGGTDNLANVDMLGFARLFFFQGMDTAAQVSDIINPVAAVTNPLPGALEAFAKTLVFLIPVVGQVLEGPAALLLLVLGLAILITFFRLFFVLLTSYVSVVLSVIFAPFQLMLTALPGYEGGFGNWLRGLIANLAVFPAVLAMLGIASNLGGRNAPTGMFVPPPLTPPLGARPAGETVGAIIAFGVLMITPQIANMIKDVLKAPAFKYGAAIFAPIGAAGGIATYPFRQVQAGVQAGVQKVVGTRIAGSLGLPTEITTPQEGQKKTA